MTEVDTDVCILGSGFGGSLLSLILNRMGLKCVAIDRAAHPRFAIGESSTPIANRVLRDLCQRYDLPNLEPLSAYGPAAEAYPEVSMGRKRGFSYFKHTPGVEFAAHADHRAELLVTASRDDYLADTHWYRQDVDALFAREVAKCECLFENTSIQQIDRQDGWRVQATRDDERIIFRSRFIVDATGESGVLLRSLGVSQNGANTQEWMTNSRAIFGHFRDMQRWPVLLESRGAALGDHPFQCDEAAVHHVLDEGWMWQLRFRNGITSAGIVLDAQQCPPDDDVTAEEEWDELVRRYPSIEQQFANARLVAPVDGLQRTGRLQRLATRSHGLDWVALPHTVGFIDPLHSSGIALTMCAVERLVSAFEHLGDVEFERHLDGYSAALRSEFRLIDMLVHGCYATRHRFDVFTTFTMVYFAAATTYEHRRHAGETVDAMLCADDMQLCEAVRDAYDWVTNLDSTTTVDELQSKIADCIAPFNRVGLCDPSVHNMYRYTAAPG